MPPKAKFTKEEIIEAAFEIVRKNGMPALTARTLGSQLGSSARPIFTVFSGMDEVINEVKTRARKEYESYISYALSQKDDRPLKMSGYMVIKFAQNEPNLFRLLFMSDEFEAIDSQSALPYIDQNYDRIIEMIKQYYKISIETAKELFFHLWIYTQGIASLCATHTCTFSDEEIKRMLSFIAYAIFGKLGIKA